MFSILRNKLSSFVKRIVGEEAVEGKMKPKLSVGSRIKEALFGEIIINEKDIEGTLDEFELSLLEADVAYEIAKGIKNELKKRLVGLRVKRGEVEGKVKDVVEKTLLDYLNGKGIKLEEMVGERKDEPFVILFVGPNGHGKTTTIAKIAHRLKSNGYSCVISASDTFRAGSIQQLEEHARKLGVEVIKHRYGADPAAVAYDARAHAKAKGIDVVLIDTAGRQETNVGLMDEMRKIARVVKPDLKIYVGESIVGNAVVEQAKEFNEAVGIDGVILTKVDVDEKGGAILSVSKAIGKPILFLSVGQGYGDLKDYDPHEVLKKILS